MSRKTEIFSIIPIFLAIFIYIFIYAQIFALLQKSVNDSNLYNSCQAVGAIVLGFFSDKFCRRKVCLYSQLIGLVLLLLMFKFQNVFLLTLLFGFAYNPLPILRAGMIDNLPHFSKIKLISYSFVIQFIPWSFYNTFVSFSPNKSFAFSIGALLISLLVVGLFFYDKRDVKIRKHSQLDFKKFLHPDAKKRFFFTLCAFFPAQLVYLFADNLVEKYSQDPEFYSVISFAFIIGALISSLYKKTPHTSVLTVNYGINMLLATIPITCLYVYGFKEISLPLQFLIFASLGGFGIPFVYDIVLRAVDSSFRGTSCGILDFIYSISSVVNFVLVDFFSVNLFFTFIIIIASFGTSMFMQKQAE